MPKRPFKDKDQDKYGEIKRLKKQFREMQEHLNKICDSSESSSEVFSTSGTFFFFLFSLMKSCQITRRNLGRDIVRYSLRDRKTVRFFHVVLI